MVDKPPSARQAAKRRASFARAERLRREAGLDQPKPKTNPARQRMSAAEAKTLIRQKRDQMLSYPGLTPKARERLDRMFAGYEREVDRSEELKARYEELKQTRQQQARQATERKKEQRTVDLAKEREQIKKLGQRAVEQRRGAETRTKSEKISQRRREEQGRSNQTKRQDEAKQTQQRTASARKSEAKRAQDQRREQIKKETARKTSHSRNLQQRGDRDRRQRHLEQVRKKAAADIERDQKRQREEQEQAHRRETDQARRLYKGVTASFRSNEIAAVARHAAACGRLDKAERQALMDLDKRQKSLIGLAGRLVPGSGRKREAQRQAVRDHYETERMLQHRNLEAVKERQFQGAQDARLAHARERLGLMQQHREGREGLRQRQDQDRPRLVEQRQQALVATQEKARTQERQQTVEQARPQPTLEFSRVR